MGRWSLAETHQPKIFVFKSSSQKQNCRARKKGQLCHQDQSSLSSTAGVEFSFDHWGDDHWPNLRWSGKTFMKIGCSEVPKQTHPSLLGPVEWKASAPLRVTRSLQKCVFCDECWIKTYRRKLASGLWWLLETQMGDFKDQNISKPTILEPLEPVKSL